MAFAAPPSKRAAWREGEVGEEARGLRGEGAFDLEHAALGGDAAGRGEADETAAGAHHAVARHHDRKWIAAERLADGAGEAGIAEAERHSP